jgi:hypothetical protein
MPMRATTVRFSESLWTLVEREAGRDGVSAAQYIRDATIVRTAYTMGHSGATSSSTRPSRASGPAERDDDPPLDGAARRTALLDAAAVAEEQGRLDALHATGLLDSDISPSFDRLARLARFVVVELLSRPGGDASTVCHERRSPFSVLGSAAATISSTARRRPGSPSLERRNVSTSSSAGRARPCARARSGRPRAGAGCSRRGSCRVERHTQG